MHQYYTEAKDSDNTFSLIISLRFTKWVNAWNLDQIRSASQENLRLWRPVASPGRRGATAGGQNMRNPAGTASSLCPHTFPVSHSLSLPQVLHPTASPGTNAKPVMTLRQRWGGGAKLQHRIGQKDVPDGELGRLELQRPWAWLKAPLQKGATQAGLSPGLTRLLGLGCLPGGEVNSKEKTDLKLGLGFQEEREDELLLLGNSWKPAGL